MEYFSLIRKTGGQYIASFPDLPNVNTHGSDLSEALAMAKEALNGALETDFERGFSLPAPQNLRMKKLHYPIAVLPHIDLAYTLKKIRNSHSQSEIAKRLGITYQAYQKLENPRKCNPTVKTLEKISEVMGRKLAILFHEPAAGGKDKPHRRPDRISRRKRREPA